MSDQYKSGFTERLNEFFDETGERNVRLAEILETRRAAITHMRSGDIMPSAESISIFKSKYPWLNLNYLIANYGALRMHEETYVDLEVSDKSMQPELAYRSRVRVMLLPTEDLPECIEAWSGHVFYVVTKDFAGFRRITPGKKGYILKAGNKIYPDNEIHESEIEELYVIK